jgi:hypothetical protein
MTTIDDTTYSQGILKQKARDFERQMHGKEWRKTKLADQEELVQLKATAAKNTAENYIQTGMAPCVAWPRAIREEILERDSD